MPIFLIFPLEMRPAMSGIRDLGTRNDLWNRDDSHFLREAPDHIVLEREQKEKQDSFQSFEERHSSNESHISFYGHRLLCKKRKTLF